MQVIYKLIKSLTLTHLFTEPYTKTVLPEWGNWELVRDYKSKDCVKLRLLDGRDNTYMNVTHQVFKEHFKRMEN